MKPLFILCIVSLTIQSANAADLLLGTPQTRDLPCMPRDTAIANDGTTYLLCDDQLVVIPGRTDADIATTPLPGAYTSISVTPDGGTLLLGGPGQQQTTLIDLHWRVDLPIDGSPLLGNADAPITVTAFLDIQCPYCSRVFPTLQQLLQKNPGRVRLVIKHFPLRMHKFARHASRAALAAAHQDAYLPYLESLFTNYRTLTDQAVQRFAEQAELDLERFNRDRSDQSTAAQVQRDLALGKQAGVRGVPAIFVNGIKAPKRSLSALSRMIAQAAATP